MFHHQVYILLFAAMALIWTPKAYADDCSSPNESDQICGGMCEPTCENPQPNRIFCPRIVCIQNLTSGCRCNDGYVRDTVSNNCLLLADCPE